MMAESTWYLRKAAPTAAICATGKACVKRLQSYSWTRTKSPGISDQSFEHYQFLPFLSISLWSQFEKRKRAAHRLILLVNRFSCSFPSSIYYSLHLEGKNINENSIISSCTTWLACSGCLDLMCVAIPELEVSLGEHPALPLLTNLLQWRHCTSRKSSFTTWKWVHQGLACLPWPGMMTRQDTLLKTL